MNDGQLMIVGGEASGTATQDVWLHLPGLADADDASVNYLLNIRSKMGLSVRARRGSGAASCRHVDIR